MKRLLAVLVIAGLFGVATGCTASSSANAGQVTVFSWSPWFAPDQQEPKGIDLAVGESAEIAGVKFTYEGMRAGHFVVRTDKQMSDRSRVHQFRLSLSLEEADLEDGMQFRLVGLASENPLIPARGLQIVAIDQSAPAGGGREVGRAELPTRQGATVELPGLAGAKAVKFTFVDYRMGKYQLASSESLLFDGTEHYGDELAWYKFADEVELRTYSSDKWVSYYVTVIG